LLAGFRVLPLPFIGHGSGELHLQGLVIARLEDDFSLQKRFKQC
jgi:hypothetical protein